MTQAAAGALDPVAIQRHTVRTLVASQALAAIGITIGIATASLLARDISGSEAQSGLAQTCQVLGAAVASYLLARLMSRRGRRVGLVVGYLLGSAGGVLAVVAGVVGSMPLLLLGAVLLGATSAANYGSRYAATDLAPERHRARALSIVVWATTIGAVAGPNLTGASGWVARRVRAARAHRSLRHRHGGHAGRGAGAGGLVAPRPAAHRPPVGRRAGRSGRRRGGRAFVVVGERPVLGAAMVVVAGAHAAMIAVMVMTPLHMEHGGAELRIIGIVISVHVLGMFAFAPLVGLLADRVGRPPVAMAGATLLLAALTLCASSPEGTSWQVFVGLFLLGLGWSFATVAGSTLVADHAPLEARTDVQGLTDLVMGLTAAVAGGLSGLIMAAWGFAVLSLLACVLPMAVGVAGYVAARATTPADVPVRDR